MIDPATSVRHNPRVVYRKLVEGSGGVLLHLDSAAYHGLNEVGTLVWTLIDEGTTFASLLTELRTRLENTPPDLAEDIAEFLEQLGERDLVVFDVEPPGPGDRASGG